MAIGLIKFRSGKKGKGVPHFDYVMHENRYKSKDTDNDKAVYKASGNMPVWAKDNPRHFWESADKYERDNGTSYREHILPLPRELNLEQQVEQIDDWINKQIGEKHPYSYAIHYKQGKDGKLQPHAHLFWSERTLDGIDRPPEQFFNRYNSKNPAKGGAKKASLGMSKYQLKKFGQELSKEWRQHVNKHLEINGIDTRVDELSNREKGLPPKTNISYDLMQVDEVEQAYRDMLQAREELQQSDLELNSIDWDSELAKLKQQLAVEQAPAPVTPVARINRKPAPAIDYNLWGIPDPAKAPEPAPVVIDKLASDKEMLKKIQKEVKRGMIDKGMIDIINKSKYKTIVDVEIFYRDKLSDILSRTAELSGNDFDELRTALTALNYIDEIKENGLLERKRLQSLPPKPVEPPPPEPEPRHTVTPTAPAQVQTVEPPRPAPEVRWTARELQAIEQSKKVLLEQIDKINDPARKAVALAELDKSIANLNPEKVKNLVDNLDKLEKDKPLPPPPPPPPEPEPRPEVKQAHEHKGKGYGDE